MSESIGVSIMYGIFGAVYVAEGTSGDWKNPCFPNASDSIEAAERIRREKGRSSCAEKVFVVIIFRTGTGQVIILILFE